MDGGGRGRIEYSAMVDYVEEICQGSPFWNPFREGCLEMRKEVLSYQKTIASSYTEYGIVASDEPTML
jgi:hypothetical protein